MAIGFVLGIWGSAKSGWLSSGGVFKVEVIWDFTFAPCYCTNCLAKFFCSSSPFCFPTPLLTCLPAPACSVFFFLG